MIFESGLLRIVLSQNILHYEKGFVLNFLESMSIDILAKIKKIVYYTNRDYNSLFV